VAHGHASDADARTNAAASAQQAAQHGRRLAKGGALAQKAGVPVTRERRARGPARVGREGEAKPRVPARAVGPHPAATPR